MVCPDPVLAAHYALQGEECPATYAEILRAGLRPLVSPMLSHHLAPHARDAQIETGTFEGASSSEREATRGILLVTNDVNSPP